MVLESGRNEGGKMQMIKEQKELTLNIYNITCMYLWKHVCMYVCLKH